jgi:hypothetical protein
MSGSGRGGLLPMNALAEITGAPLDIEGVVGDDLEFALFFGYHPVTGFTFDCFVELDPSPLRKTVPLVVTVLDGANGLIEVSLSRTETLKLGPVSRCPWKLSWVESGKTRTITMGNFALNRL